MWPQVLLPVIYSLASSPHNFSRSVFYFGQLPSIITATLKRINNKYTIKASSVVDSNVICTNLCFPQPCSLQFDDTLLLSEHILSHVPLICTCSRLLGNVTSQLHLTSLFLTAKYLGSGSDLWVCIALHDANAIKWTG